jgi:hypothetical protein
VPYKDPQRKQHWETRNRRQSLARRRELRRVEAAQKTTQPVSPDPTNAADFPWHLLAGGGVLAFYNPALALGAGSLMLIAAALRKETWHWWIIGAAIVTMAFFPCEIISEAMYEFYVRYDFDENSANFRVERMTRPDANFCGIRSLRF